MGSNRSLDQVYDDSHTLGEYPIMVGVRVMVRFRFRVRVQLLMEQPHELRIIIK